MRAPSRGENANSRVSVFPEGSWDLKLCSVPVSPGGFEGGQTNLGGCESGGRVRAEEEVQSSTQQPALHPFLFVRFAPNPSLPSPFQASSPGYSHMSLCQSNSHPMSQFSILLECLLYQTKLLEGIFPAPSPIPGAY